MNAPAPPRHRQRGAATLVVVLALFAALALATLFSQRGLLLEARMSANQARATTAFEAAEAGLDWALAQLNTLDRSGADCRADASATTAFRDRAIAASRSGLAARITADGTTLRAACIRNDGAWRCSCPDTGVPTPPASSDADPARFEIQLLPGARPGIVRVASVGTLGATSARVEAAFALMPALGSAPAAAVTARGRITAGMTPFGAANPDARSAGIVLHAGAGIDAPAARLSTTAGSSLDGTVAAGDAALAALDAERVFVRWFGLPLAAWRDQPAVRRIACDGDCGSTLAAAIGADEVVHPLIAIDGDTTLSGPLTLGRPDRPVVIVVAGRLELSGPVTIHGVVFANDVAWTGAAGGTLRGALLSAGDVAIGAASDLHRDAAVLDTLMQRHGSFVRVPGSWRDF